MKTPELSPYELAFQAESGDPGAQFRLGMLFLLGEKVEQDLSAAYRWVARAAEAQHVGAQMLLVKLAALESVREDNSSGLLGGQAARLLSRMTKSVTVLVEKVGQHTPLRALARGLAQPASLEGVRPIGTPRKSTSLVDAA